MFLDRVRVNRSKARALGGASACGKLTTLERDWTIVAARDLAAGDTIGVDYEDGEWVVDVVFFEGPDVVVLDLTRNHVLTTA